MIDVVVHLRGWVLRFWQPIGSGTSETANSGHQDRSAGTPCPPGSTGQGWGAQQSADARPLRARDSVAASVQVSSSVLNLRGDGIQNDDQRLLLPCRFVPMTTFEGLAYAG